jgi:hypothetical protein
MFSKKGVAPPTQDATLPADKIRVGGKVCFFCTFLQTINKRCVRDGALRLTLYLSTSLPLTSYLLPLKKYRR